MIILCTRNNILYCRIRLKSADGWYSDTPFMTLVNYGDAVYNDWVHVQKQFTLPPMSREYQVSHSN